MCFCIRPCGCFRYACLMSTLCMLLHLSALIALMRGLSMSPPRCPCPVFCMYLSVEACLSPSLPFAVFALRLVGCDNVCCSSLVLSITAGSGRFPAVNSQSIYVPFGLVNSKKKLKYFSWLCPGQPTVPLIVCFFFFGINKTKRYIDTLGVHSWEPPGTSRYAQHQR